MKKNVEFRICYDVFDLESSQFEEQRMISYDEEFVNYKINELYHNEDTSYVLVQQRTKDSKEEWKDVDICDDHTKNWKNYSHMFYMINL